MAAETISEEDAQKICNLKKTASPSQDWPFLGCDTWKMGFGVVCTPPRRGLVVEIYASIGQKVSRRKLNIGLWDQSGGGFVRVYQLTIAPAWLPTHSERGETWYGSHEHMGRSASILQQLNDAPFDEALRFFCSRVNLELEDPIEDPFGFKLKP